MAVTVCVTVLTSAGCSTPATPSGTAGRGDFAGLVDIGDGRELYLECRGAGSPTVFFVSGRSDRAAIWDTTEPDESGDDSTVFSRVADDTRACAYDRPGTVTIRDEQVEPTASTAVPQPAAADAGVADLKALMNAADIGGPYVLVAHSWGGVIARLFAATHPADVAGHVLIDTVTELLYENLTEEQRPWWLSLNSDYSPDLEPYHQEKTDFVAGFDMLRGAPAPPDVPAAILVSDEPYDLTAMAVDGRLPNGAPADFGATVFDAHLAGQLELAAQFGVTPLLRTQAGHYIQTEQPDLTVEVVKTVVAQSRPGD